jgi:hypothetical protein
VSFAMDQKRIVLYLDMTLFLFGYMKRNMMPYRVEYLSELLVRIQVILKAVLGETLISRVDETIVTMYGHEWRVCMVN